MKLLYVVPEFGPAVTGGIATYYRHLVPELARLGHTVHVIVASANEDEPAEDIPGVAVTRVQAKAAEADLRRFDSLAILPGLQQRLARAWAAWRIADGGEGYDAVETTDYGMLFVPWLSQPSRAPVLIQLHGSNGQLLRHDPVAGDELSGCVTRLLETSLLPRAEELQSYGRPNACEWSRLLGRDVVHVLPAWRPGPDTEPTPLPEGAEGLVVGRVQCWKGPEVLCKALRQLGADAPKIAWVGSDTHYRRAEAWMGDHLAATYPDIWGRKIFPIGRKTPGEVAALQAAARFIVVPSDWDVFNLSTVEGMARGKVVICSEGAGAADVIRDGESGFRFPAGDAPALTVRLRRVLELDEAQTRRIGAAARQAVACELDVTKVACQRLDRLQALAKQKSGKDRPDVSALLGAADAGEDPWALLERLPLRRLVSGLSRQAFKRLRKRLGW
jgi:glycosyltransferase involved in cell wall biosynthesis